jgi:stage V sporulation protein R
MYVVDANYLNRGELYLAHEFSGLEVDQEKAERVLRNLRVLWGRPVHLQARIREEMMLISIGDPDDEPHREKITEDTPEPAHVIA